MAVSSLHTKGNKGLRQKWKQKKKEREKEFFKHLRGNIPKDETIAEINQGIQTCARVRSEEYSRKGMGTKTGQKFSSVQKK